MASLGVLRQRVVGRGRLMRTQETNKREGREYISDKETIFVSVLKTISSLDGLRKSDNRESLKV